MYLLSGLVIFVWLLCGFISYGMEKGIWKVFTAAMYRRYNQAIDELESGKVLDETTKDRLLTIVAQQFMPYCPCHERENKLRVLGGCISLYITIRLNIVMNRSTIAEQIKERYGVSPIRPWAFCLRMPKELCEQKTA